MSKITHRTRWISDVVAASHLTNYLNDHSTESWELMGLIPLNTQDLAEHLNCLVVHRKYFTEESREEADAG